jgi:hypothetical protein
MRYQLSFMRISSSREEDSIEQLKDVGSIVHAVRFGTGRESTNDMEHTSVPDDREHKIFALDSLLTCVAISFLGRAHIRRRPEIRKN